MGKGNFTLDDGTQIEAGRFNTNKKGSFGEFNFSQGFQYAPVVLAGVTSFNETKHRKYSIQLVDANRDLTYRAAKLKTIYHIAYRIIYRIKQDQIDVLADITVPGVVAGNFQLPLESE